jgi:bifunctional oligoribonuclease and PAP phosphatase NrnA
MPHAESTRLMMTVTPPEIASIADAIRVRRRFVVSSHARPDGDAIGSSMAMAFALRALGKEAHVVNRDPAPGSLIEFPGVPEIEIASSVNGHYDAAIIMECGDLARTGISGLDRSFIINIDHHPGNAGFGHLNWFDPSAAACAEMVFQLIETLGVPLSIEIATHVYLAILTDTGSFHFSNMTPRTFEIARRVVEAGVDPAQIARRVYDSNNLGRVKLFGAVLNSMQIDRTGRIAVLYIDHQMARDAGGTYDDIEGLINEPLTVKDLLAVVFFKQSEGSEYRVSLRSKSTIDVGAVAKQFGGGGHKNAAGCTVVGDVDDLKRLFIERIEAALAMAGL